MKFPNYLLKKKIQDLAITSKNRAHNFCSLNDNHTIMLMFNINDWALVEPCIKELNKHNQRTTICAFVPKEFDAQTDETWFVVREEEDTNFFQIPNDDICQRINNLSADILIDLTRSDDCVMHYLLLQHPVKFKVGKKVYLQNIHDLEIAMTDGDNIQDLFKHILFYLQTIRSK